MAKMVSIYIIKDSITMYIYNGTELRLLSNLNSDIILTCWVFGFSTSMFS